MNIDIKHESSILECKHYKHQISHISFHSLTNMIHASFKISILRDTCENIFGRDNKRRTTARSEVCSHMLSTRCRFRHSCIDAWNSNAVISTTSMPRIAEICTMARRNDTNTSCGTQASSIRRRNFSGLQQHLYAIRSLIGSTGREMPIS